MFLNSKWSIISSLYRLVLQWCWFFFFKDKYLPIVFKYLLEIRLPNCETFLYFIKKRHGVKIKFYNANILNFDYTIYNSQKIIYRNYEHLTLLQLLWNRNRLFWSRKLTPQKKKIQSASYCVKIVKHRCIP